MKVHILIILICGVCCKNIYSQQIPVVDTITTKIAVKIEEHFLTLSKKLKLTGYTQPRFQYFEDTARTSGFDIRRARLALTGSMTDKISYRFFAEFAGGGSPQLLEAIFHYQFTEHLKFSIGQMLVPLDNDIMPLKQKWKVLTVLC